MIPVKRLSHVTMESPDVDRQAEYYKNVIGLVELGKDGRTVHLGTQLGTLAVTLEPSPQWRLARLCLQIDAATELSEVARVLDERNIASVGEKDVYPGIPALQRLVGPDGLIIDLANVVEPQTPQPGKGGVNPLKLQHVASVTQNLDTTLAFYQNVMGFRFSDALEDFFYWLRCSPDHHTLNFIAGQRTGLHHVAFEFLDRAHFYDACEVLGSHDVEVFYGPARAGVGHNLHVYHRAPDGYLVEFFTELDQLSDESLGYYDPRPWHRDRPQRPKVWKYSQDRLAVWGTRPPAGWLD